ncbi:hypothetical protein [Stenotrophomonas rhizophila]|uniref:Uncharacterized protein n=1 Tax=Stenotrophomonas rhizophila TaxID=216778 RepID=A0A7V7YE44_9GAMM|nr:hypothetical protein [Stenotrophomonas rhizophila]KAB7628890.1 hypothetical protein F9K92_15695 [Stenotrophomonas rhizophila]
MGEWSDYFEDFPEENPANFVDGRFDPKGAAEMHARQMRLTEQQAALDSTVARMIQEGKDRQRAKSGKS